MADKDDLLVAAPEQAEPSLSVAAEDSAGPGIASGEVRVVEPPEKKSPGALLLAVLLLVVLLGGGFYLVRGTVVSSPSTVAVTDQQPVPKRYPIDKPIVVEVIDPAAAVLAASAKEAVAANNSVTPVEAPAVEKPSVEKPLAVSAAVPPAAAYQVLVGPFLYISDLQVAEKQLEMMGYQTEVTAGSGVVAMFRLLEGAYPAVEARERLQKIKQQVGDAFLLPAGDKLAVYVGSFTNRERAVVYAEKLAKQGIDATPLVSEVEMRGKMLLATEAGQQDARSAAARLIAAGFNAQVVRK